MRRAGGRRPQAGRVCVPPVRGAWCPSPGRPPRSPAPVRRTVSTTAARARVPPARRRSRGRTCLSAGPADFRPSGNAMLSRCPKLVCVAMRGRFCGRATIVATLRRVQKFFTQAVDTDTRLRLVKGSSRAMYWCATVGSNLRIGYEASRFDRVIGLVFSATGRRQPDRSLWSPPLRSLTSGSKKGKRRRRSPGGSVGRASARWVEQTLAISAFQAITMAYHDSGQPGRGASRVKVPVTQRFLGLTSKPNQNRNFQLESLILAQNERWRQA